MLLVRESAAECDPQDRGQEPDIRHRDRQDGVGMRDAAELTHDGPRIDKVLQYIGADDQVEAALEHVDGRLDGVTDHAVEHRGG